METPRPPPQNLGSWPQPPGLMPMIRRVKIATIIIHHYKTIHHKLSDSEWPLILRFKSSENTNENCALKINKITNTIPKTRIGIQTVTIPVSTCLRWGYWGRSTPEQRESRHGAILHLSNSWMSRHRRIVTSWLCYFPQILIFFL